jgi:hypothetical protein
VFIVPGSVLIENLNGDSNTTDAFSPHVKKIMVGVGGRSKACDNCRRRRIKCGTQTTKIQISSNKLSWIEISNAIEAY